MIIAGDADLVLNAVTRKEGPLQMGVNEFNPDYQFANKDFFLNGMDYLASKSPVMETRNKELTLRLLDSEKVRTEKTKWQIIAFAVPIGAILLFAMAFQYFRQRKYAR